MGVNVIQVTGAVDWPHVETDMSEWKEWVMAGSKGNICSPINKPGGPKPPGKPMKGSSKPISPGACSMPK
jgi:hypothetical protein